jgi:DNA-binding transcriptional ArsR family regulator
LVSQHLRVLREVRVVDCQRHGHEITYRLVDERVARIVLDAVNHVERLPRDDPRPSTLDQSSPLRRWPGT